MRVQHKSKSASDLKPSKSTKLPVTAARQVKPRQSGEGEDDVYDPDWEVSDSELEGFEKLYHLDD